MGISQNALARAAGVPPRRINEIVLGKRSITADTAIRLAAALGTSKQFWLGLQAEYDLRPRAACSARRSTGSNGSRHKKSPDIPACFSIDGVMRVQRCLMISSANSLHFTSVAPSIRRAKS